jgi:hypothetical protein
VNSEKPLGFLGNWPRCIIGWIGLLSAMALKRSNKRGSAKRQLIDTGKDKRYVRRNPQGQFKESDDVGRSLAADRRKKAKTRVKPGRGDRGDRVSAHN